MKRILILAAVLMLTGCAQQMNAMLKGDDGLGYYTIQDVRVTYAPSIQEDIRADDQFRVAEGARLGKSGEEEYKPFDQVLRKAALDTFQRRDYDEQGVPAVVEIQVVNLELTNSLSVILIGGADRVAATARVYDASTHALLRDVGEDVYNMESGIDGLVGRAINSPREKLADDLSSYLADKIFIPW